MERGLVVGHFLAGGGQIGQQPAEAQQVLIGQEVLQAQPVSQPERIDTEAIAQVTKLKQLVDACRNLRGVKDVRVKGAIGVVEMQRIDDLDALRARFIEQGVFVRPFGHVIYLTPAFTIAADELKTLTDAVVNVIRAI